MPERDAWDYKLSDADCGRAAGCSGPAQVCNVFVCKMWRAGGLFNGGPAFDCGEQTPLDTYSMALFEVRPDALPAVLCGAACPIIEFAI